VVIRVSEGKVLCNRTSCAYYANGKCTHSRPIFEYKIATCKPFSESIDLRYPEPALVCKSYRVDARELHLSNKRVDIDKIWNETIGGQDLTLRLYILAHLDDINEPEDAVLKVYNSIRWGHNPIVSLVEGIKELSSMLQEIKRKRIHT